MTLSEAADYLNVTERFVRRLVAERRVSFHKVGKFVRFTTADLDKLFASGRVDLVDRRTSALGRDCQHPQR